MSDAREKMARWFCKNAVDSAFHGEWKSIETAPESGYIIGAWLDGGRWLAAQLFHEYGEWVDVRSDVIHQPIYWMPVPPESAPQKQAVEKEPRHWDHLYQSEVDSVRFARALKEARVRFWELGRRLSVMDNAWDVAQEGAEEITTALDREVAGDDATEVVCLPRDGNNVGPFEPHWIAFLGTICLTRQYKVHERERVWAELQRIADAIRQALEGGQSDD